jgi:hypothetical protein
MVAALLLAGCAGSETTDDAVLPEEPAPPVDLWNGSKRQVIADVGGNVIMFDVLCLMGGAPDLGRADGYVLPGTEYLEITLEVPLTMTHLQAGYGYVASDRGGRPEYTWLDPVAPGNSAVFLLPVAPEQTEQPGEERWFFSYRNNPGTEAACYTGGGSGTFTLRAEAVRG